MMWARKVVCLVICVEVVLAHSQSMVVELEGQGLVRGYKNEEGDMFSFLDVPYATSPTGIHKYKAPLPPPVWTETFDAVNRKIACHQVVTESNAAEYNVQEDCLVANIFVPNINATNLPVLVEIHGGAYQRGASFNRPMSNLVTSKRLIVVSFNYRIGVRGFLCLGTEDVPGNAGLKDQVALLRWVNKNIGNFGGNPIDVTISGCSAGGGSVDFLTISPMATGLFNKAIVGSGAVFGGTGPQVDPVENAKYFARLLNFTDTNDFDALELFYKTASYELLTSIGADDIMEYERGSLLLFAPCVERKTGGEIFLHEPPINVLTKGNYQKVPLLYGFSEKEGTFRLSYFNEWVIEMNDKFSDFLPTDLQFENETQKDEVAETVKYFYFGNKTVSEETVSAYIDYFTDVMFAYHMLRTANMRRVSQGDTIYIYQYSFVDENTPSILNTNVQGPGHCDQSLAVADEDVTHATDEYKIMKNTMRETSINFVTTGNPTPEGSPLYPWPAVDGFLSPFMSFNVLSRVENTSLLEERYRFWDSIYAKHYRVPLAPDMSSVT